MGIAALNPSYAKPLLYPAHDKTGDALQGLFLQFDGVDLGALRATFEPGRQLPHSAFLPFQQHLDPAVGEVAPPAIERQTLGLLVGVLTVAHPLDPTADVTMQTDT